MGFQLSPVMASKMFQEFRAFRVYGFEGVASHYGRGRIRVLSLRTPSVREARVGLQGWRVEVSGWMYICRCAGSAAIVDLRFLGCTVSSTAVSRVEAAQSVAEHVERMLRLSKSRFLKTFFSDSIRRSCWLFLPSSKHRSDGGFVRQGLHSSISWGDFPRSYEATKIPCAASSLHEISKT